MNKKNNYSCIIINAIHIKLNKKNKKKLEKNLYIAFNCKEKDPLLPFMGLSQHLRSPNIT